MLLDFHRKVIKSTYICGRTLNKEFTAYGEIGTSDLFPPL